VVEGRLVCGNDASLTPIRYAFASDLMSDVLTVTENEVLLITGLSSVQVIRTAVMSDIQVVLIIRNKSVTDEMKAAAEQSGITVITSRFSMFRASGMLFKAGLEAVF
jgi:hypothetical protein